MMNLKIFDKHSPNSIKYRNCVKSPYVLARIDAVLASKNINKNEIDEIERLMRISSVVYPAPYLLSALFTNTVDQEPNRKSNMDNTKSNQKSNQESNTESNQKSNQESDIESNTESNMDNTKSNQESDTDNAGSNQELNTESNPESNTDNTESGQSKKKSGRKSKSAE